MRAVHGVAGLEGHHTFPAALGDFAANRHRCAEGIGEVLLKVGVIEHFNRPRDHCAALSGESRHTRVLRVIGAEDLIENRRHVFIRERLDGLDRHHRQQGCAFSVRVSEREALAGLYRAALCQIDHRHRPKKAVGGAHVLRY